MQGEEYFVKLYRKNQGSVFFKYLVALIYNQNDKTEKYYEVLNDIDLSKTPVYEVLERKLHEKDQKNDEEDWLAALKNYMMYPREITIL